MDKNIIFVSGTHGVGKTTFCEFLESEMEIKAYSAGTLINEYINNSSISKEVSDVEGNQEILISSIQNLISENSFILDGHFCLLDEQRSVQKIPFKTFSLLSPMVLIVLYDDISKIQDRLRIRDSRFYDSKLLEELQEKELAYSSEIANTLKIPVYHLKLTEDHKKIIQELKKVLGE